MTKIFENYAFSKKMIIINCAGRKKLPAKKIKKRR